MKINEIRNSLMYIETLLKNDSYNLKDEQMEKLLRKLYEFRTLINEIYGGK